MRWARTQALKGQSEEKDWLSQSLVSLLCTLVSLLCTLVSLLCTLVSLLCTLVSLLCTCTLVGEGSSSPPLPFSLPTTRYLVLCNNETYSARFFCSTGYRYQRQAWRRRQ